MNRQFGIAVDCSLPDIYGSDVVHVLALTRAVWVIDTRLALPLQPARLPLCTLVREEGEHVGVQKCLKKPGTLVLQRVAEQNLADVHTRLVGKSLGHLCGLPRIEARLNGPQRHHEPQDQLFHSDQVDHDVYLFPAFSAFWLDVDEEVLIDAWKRELAAVHSEDRIRLSGEFAPPALLSRSRRALPRHLIADGRWYGIPVGRDPGIKARSEFGFPFDLIV